VRVRVWESLEVPAERLEARAGARGGPSAGAEPEPPLHELLLASVPTPVLRSFRDRLLGPLREYDDMHNADLVTTLRLFLACDGSWSACASRMYVHVNTVRYRISRVEALTGRDLSALADRVDFFLALRGA
jgi:DNA-binding PucR family transcriptional regulator